MLRLIVFFLMSYNFVVVVAAPWSEELLEEFQALAKEASTKTGSATFEISEDLRKALFKIKSPGRIANRRFIEIKNSFSGQNTEKTISFLAEPLEKFKAFLQACFRDNKYQQPTQRSDHFKQIKTERATSVHTEPSFPTAIESPYTPVVKLPPLFNLERMAPTVTSTPHNVRRLTMVTNEGIHFPGCPEFNEAPADTLQKPSDDILRGSDQIIIISLRESKKRGLSGNINHVWVEDISIIPLPVGKALSIACQDNKIYTLSPSHIEVLEDNKFTQIPCLLKSLKHFLPMKNGDFITTSLLDDQWWISIHRSSGAIASICAANLTIIALTGVTPTTAAFLTDSGVFFLRTDSNRDPVLEFYFKLENNYKDIFCKISNGQEEFFVLNSIEGTIEKIYHGHLNKLHKQVLSNEQEHLKNISAIKYDAKNDRVLAVHGDTGQIFMLSCTLNILRKCHPILGLKDFCIDGEGAILCLREQPPNS